MKCLRKGITRTEVIALIGLVACVSALIFPALQSTSATARAKICTLNLKNLGLALTTYHAAFQFLPPAASWDKGEMILDANLRPARNADTVKSTRENWAHLLLPYVDEKLLYNKFNKVESITSARNKEYRVTPLQRMTCPEDDFNSEANQYVLEDSSGSKYSFARGNYAINGGPQTNAEEPGYLSFPIASGNVIQFSADNLNFQWWGNGIAGFNRCFSLDDFANGRSTMVAVDEIRSGIVPEDPRGVWALGQIGSSITWAHGVNSDDYGPNNQARDSDDILEGTKIATEYDIQQFVNERMPFCVHCNYSNQATSRSKHSGGVNVLMLDGNVRFVSNDISPSLWHVMHSRDTPSSALTNKFDERLSSEFPAVTGFQLTSQSEAIAEPKEDLRECLQFRNSIGMLLKEIRPGKFTMGLPDADNVWPFPSVAKPHEVIISRPYFIGVYEVTQGEFSQLMEVNPSWHSPYAGGKDLLNGVDPMTLPVENVSWYEASSFCQRLSEMPEEIAANRFYRLPTEAEWEFACRSGSTEPYPFNPDWESKSESGEIAGLQRHPTNPQMPPEPVGSYDANGFGLHDMRGNVFEWCDDWFLREYYSISPSIDPKGPEHGYLKTVRGWDWTFVGPQCKDFLITSAPWQKNRYIGFRVVCVPRSPQ